MRRALAATIVVIALVVVPGMPASAGDPVQDRKAAQAKANAAAARFANASTSLARIERELKELEARMAATRSRLGGLEGEVRQVAVNSYVRGNVSQAFVFDKDLSVTSRRNALARFVTVGDTDALDQFRAAQDDLEAGSGAIRKQVASRKSAAADLRKQKASAYAELHRLAAVEKAYLAKVAAAKAAAARRAADAKSAASRAAAAAPTSTRATKSDASGRVTGVIGSGEWVCPVQGPHSFSNDWGQPRSGGRTHQGNDILNARGTPIVAPVSGTVRQHDSSLGGLSFYLSGDDGNTYYGTHMAAYAASGRVAAGTVVGYNGDSGNARGTPHLHFEIHPGGGGAVNPYPTLTKYC